MVATPTARRPDLRITEAKVETAHCFHTIEVLVHQRLAKVHHQIANQNGGKSGDSKREERWVFTVPDEGKGLHQEWCCEEIAAAAILASM
jgi:hypothetical protein